MKILRRDSRYARIVHVTETHYRNKVVHMLFGCLPIQNIPVFIIGYGLVAFSVWVTWQDYKDERHAKGVARVRRCEIHRKAMHLMKQGRKSRAERMKAYYKN